MKNGAPKKRRLPTHSPQKRQELSLFGRRVPLIGGTLASTCRLVLLVHGLIVSGRGRGRLTALFAGCALDNGDVAVGARRFSFGGRSEIHETEQHGAGRNGRECGFYAVFLPWLARHGPEFLFSSER